MRRTIATLSALLVLGGVVVFAWMIMATPYSVASVYATEGDETILGRFHWWRLMRLEECPGESFELESPIGLVANGFGTPNTDSEKVLDLLTLLLAKGCDINARSAFGPTALHGAIASGDKELVEFLLQNGADPNLRYEWREISGYTYRESELDGLNSLELAKAWQERLGGREQVVDLLQAYVEET